MSTNRYFLRAVVLTGAAGLTGLLAAGAASAHVTANVYGDQPEQGGYGAIVLRVPNEEEKVGTTKLEVTIPEEYAISSARTKPVPGWTAEVIKTDVVSKITWTAQEGNQIAAGSTSYEEFPFTLGKLPENVDTLVLAAAQTYSDGKVVNWDAPPAENGEEPEHPAPVVELAEASGEGHSGGAHEAETEAAGGAEAAPASDDTARWLGGAGLVVGALGLGVGAGATVRARKRTSA
ncbi:YcnI family copper-binding membrane protein [Qaidamihabitans albus]|uniref:YcnI family copper-binding membrane protein n=1 Tax=Qaidamihabitans albus TaxID=2795733 RepID=UPI0018F1C092|nr:YcnI family protein [Qaidamihabitans albus]